MAPECGISSARGAVATDELFRCRCDFEADFAAVAGAADGGGLVCHGIQSSGLLLVAASLLVGLGSEQFER